MPLYKVVRFAQMTGKNPKDIHAYVAQKKLVKTKEGFIDTDTIINATFLAKHQDKAVKKELDGLNAGESSTPPSGTGDYFLDVKRGEYLDVQIAKGKIDLEKKHGEVFPIELVKELVMKQAKALTSGYRQHLAQILDLWEIRFKIPHGEIVKALKEMGVSLNKVQLEAIEATKNEIKSIAREYGGKRGIGEHE